MILGEYFVLFLRITLPDGKVKDGIKWKTTPFEIAAQISKSLASNAVIARVDEDLWDMHRALEGHCNLQLYTFDNDEGRDTFWHSSAHILGQVTLNYVALLNFF